MTWLEDELLSVTQGRPILVQGGAGTTDVRHYANGGVIVEEANELPRELGPLADIPKSRFREISKSVAIERGGMARFRVWEIIHRRWFPENQEL